GLNHRGIADAVQPALRARRIAPRFEFGESPFRDTAPDRFLIVAGVERGPAGGPVRKAIGRNQVAPDNVEWVEPELDRDALDQAFQREIDLRATEAAIEPARRLVGDDDAVADRQMAD